MIEERLVSLKVCRQSDGEAWKLIKYSIHPILKEDDRWHFFMEGSYFLIRCQEKFVEPILDLARNIKVGVIHEGEWEDPIRITQRYQDLFEPIFHNYSLLALRVEGNREEMKRVLDRVIHCFLNMAIIRLPEEVDLLLEPTMIMKSALERAFTIGSLVTQWEAQSAKKNKGT